MKKKHKAKFGPLGIVIGVLLIALVAYVATNKNVNQMSTNTAQEQTKTFQSKSLKLSLKIPNAWQVDQGMTFVNIISDQGKVNISRIATNFNDLSSYLTDFDSKRKIAVVSETNLNIEKFNAVDRVEKFNGGPISQQKVYFIYVEGWIYSLSTSSDFLFNDLDQIAGSFRYTP